MVGKKHAAAAKRKAASEASERYSPYPAIGNIITGQQKSTPSKYVEWRDKGGEESRETE